MNPAPTAVSDDELTEAQRSNLEVFKANGQKPAYIESRRAAYAASNKQKGLNVSAPVVAPSIGVTGVGAAETVRPEYPSSTDMSTSRSKAIEKDTAFYLGLGEDKAAALRKAQDKVTNLSTRPTDVEGRRIAGVPDVQRTTGVGAIVDALKPQPLEKAADVEARRQADARAKEAQAKLDAIVKGELQAKGVAEPSEMQVLQARVAKVTELRSRFEDGPAGDAKWKAFAEQVSPGMTDPLGHWWKGATQEENKDASNQLYETPIATALRDLGALSRTMTTPVVKALTYEVDESGAPLDPADPAYKVASTLPDWMPSAIGLGPRAFQGIKARPSTGTMTGDIARDMREGRTLGDDFSDMPEYQAAWTKLGFPNVPKVVGLGAEFMIPVLPPVGKGLKLVGKGVELAADLAGAPKVAKVGASIADPLAAVSRGLAEREAVRLAQGLELPREALVGAARTDRQAGALAGRLIQQEVVDTAAALRAVRAGEVPVHTATSKAVVARGEGLAEFEKSLHPTVQAAAKVDDAAGVRKVVEQSVADAAPGDLRFINSDVAISNKEWVGIKADVARRVQTLLARNPDGTLKNADEVLAMLPKNEASRPVWVSRVEEIIKATDDEGMFVRSFAAEGNAREYALLKDYLIGQAALAEANKVAGGAVEVLYKGPASAMARTPVERRTWMDDVGNALSEMRRDKSVVKAKTPLAIESGLIDLQGRYANVVDTVKSDMTAELKVTRDAEQALNNLVVRAANGQRNFPRVNEEMLHTFFGRALTTEERLVIASRLSQAPSSTGLTEMIDILRKGSADLAGKGLRNPIKGGDAIAKTMIVTLVKEKRAAAAGEVIAHMQDVADGAIVSAGVRYWGFQGGYSGGAFGLEPRNYQDIVRASVEKQLREGVGKGALTFDEMKALLPAKTSDTWVENYRLMFDESVTQALYRNGFPPEMKGVDFINGIPKSKDIGGGWVALYGQDFADAMKALDSSTAAGNIDKALESLRIKDAEGLEQVGRTLGHVVDTARRGTIGGMLGGGFLPNMKFHFNNAATAPLVIGTTINLPFAMQAIPDVGRQLINWGAAKLGKTPFEVAFKDMAGDPVTYKMLDEEMAKANITLSQAGFEFSNQFLNDLQRVSKTLDSGKNAGRLRTITRYLDPTNKNIYSIAADLNDNTWRQSVYVTARVKGSTPEQAAELARASLFDYGRIKPIEREYVAKTMMFYGWWRSSLLEVAKTAVTAPSKLKQQLMIQKALELEIADQLEYAPGYALTRLYGMDREDYDTLSKSPVFGPEIPAFSSLQTIANVTNYLLADGKQVRDLGDMLDDTRVSPTIDFGKEVLMESARTDAAGFHRVPPKHVNAVMTIGEWDAFRETFDVEPVPAEMRTAGEPEFAGQQFRFRTSGGYLRYKAVLLGLTYVALQRAIDDYSALLPPVPGADLKRFEGENPVLLGTGIVSPIKIKSEVEALGARQKEIKRELDAMAR